MAMLLRHLRVFILIVWVFMALHSCIPACGKTFHSSKGLRIHQDSCKTFTFKDPALLSLEARLTARQVEREARRLQHSTENINTTEVGSFPKSSSSSFVINNEHLQGTSVNLEPPDVSFTLPGDITPTIEPIHEPIDSIPPLPPARPARLK